MIQQQWTDFSQGMLTPTGNSLDLALSGQGLLRIEFAQRNHFYQRRTISGFQIEPVAERGRLHLARYSEQRSADYGGSNAANRNRQGRHGAAERATVGQIEISGIDDPAADLEQAGQAAISRLRPAGQASLPIPATEVRQGALEQSNVPVADSAVRLVSIMRQFEMLQKAMSVGAEMDKQAVEEVAKVSQANLEKEVSEKER